jgi:hypothetical protein
MSVGNLARGCTGDFLVPILSLPVAAPIAFDPEACAAREPNDEIRDIWRSLAQTAGFCLCAIEHSARACNSSLRLARVADHHRTCLAGPSVSRHGRGSTGGRERRAWRRSDLQPGVVGDALDDRRCAIAAMIFRSLPQFGRYSRSVANTCASGRAERIIARLLKRLSAAGGDRQIMAVMHSYA